MKLKIIFTAVIAMFVYFGKAQTEPKIPNQEECAKYKSLYYQYLREGMFQDARQFWLKAFHVCGGTKNLNEAFFINGKAIYDGLRRDVLKDDSLKQGGIIDTMKWIYEQHLTIAPGPELELKYADFLMYNKDTDYFRLDTLFQSVDELREKTEARYLRLYFRHLLFNRFNNSTSGEKDNLRAEIFDTYLRLNKYAILAIEKADTIPNEKERTEYLEAYNSTREFLAKYVQRAVRDKLLVQEKLNTEFDRIPARKGVRKMFLTAYIQLLESYAFLEIPVYAKYVYASVELEPTAEGYKGIAKIELNKKAYHKSIEAYQKALSLDTGDSLKNQLHYELAVVHYSKGDYFKAYELAGQVKGSLEGQAIKLRGDCVAATADNCGESTFVRRANFWLANDYYQKAANLGVAVSPHQYMDAAPDHKMCFDAGVSEGDSVELSCWETTTKVRF